MESDKIIGRNDFNFWCEDICGSLLEKACQFSFWISLWTLVLNLVIPAIWSTSSAFVFWMTSLFGICMCEQQCCERFDMANPFCSKREDFFFLLACCRILLYTLVSSPLVSVCYTICKR